MSETSLSRGLIHGPAMIDLTDLLYYDCLVLTQETLKFIEYIWHHPIAGSDHLPYISLPHMGIFGNDTLEVLMEAEMIILNNNLPQQQLAQFDWPNFDSFKDEVGNPSASWFSVTDKRIRDFSQMAKDFNLSITPKYHNDEFSAIYKTGNYGVLNIIFSHLPRLDASHITYLSDWVSYSRDLIDFLKDEDTQIKRRRLYAWQNDIEIKVEKGDIKLEHIPDLIATCLDDYINWMKTSELKFKYDIYELLIYVAANIISGLTLVGLPNAIKNLVEFKKRELALKEVEMQAPGRELAFIVHAHRKFLK